MSDEDLTADPDTAAILRRVAAERRRQRDQWGNQHDDAHSVGDWLVLTAEWVGRVAEHLMDPPHGYGHAFLQAHQNLYVKLAAVACAAAESIARKLHPGNIDDQS